MQSKRKQICIVATIPFPLVVFMKPHIAMLADYFDVTLIANGTELDFSEVLNHQVKFIPVNISRKISLKQDLIALYQLCRIFREHHFDVVHTLMPKTALLGMLAAFIARIPHRIHTFTGQVWANKTGVSRYGLKILDKLIAKCATGLLTDSQSQRQFLIDQGVAKADKLVVLGAGSVCGVDMERFKPNQQVRSKIRADLGISDSAVVYLFLGRLNKDKGVQDLAYAFSEIAVDFPNIHLLVVGPDEGGMDEKLRTILLQHLPRFHRIGFTDKPQDYMACADIFCLPSYREGFGSVIIEAAAAGLPSVASNIYGLIDAVKAGETGILHQPKNVNEIKQALLKLTNDEYLRKEMSKQAMIRAKSFFSTDLLVQEMRTYYQQLLGM